MGGAAARLGPPEPGWLEDPLLASDKLAGALLGLVAGETLGLVVDGWSRDQVLRAHGRLAHLPEGARPGPATAFARSYLEERLAGRPAPETAPAGRELLEALLATLLALAGGGVGEAAAPGAGTEPDGTGAGVAAALLSHTLLTAFRSHPCQRLRASELLDRLAALPSAPPAAPALRLLAAQVRSPSPPLVAFALYQELPAALREAALAVHSLLVRPASPEDAVVYAVNLGGSSALRGALAGALAGAHRGGASVPERWTRAVPEALELGRLGRTLGRPKSDR